MAHYSKNQNSKLAIESSKEQFSSPEMPHLDRNRVAFNNQRRITKINHHRKQQQQKQHLQAIVLNQNYHILFFDSIAFFPHDPFD